MRKSDVRKSELYSMRTEFDMDVSEKRVEVGV